MLLTVGGLRAQTLAPPDLACAATLVNGDVLLTWNVPVNGCGPFVSYDIYASNASSSGPYSLLASITNQATTSYTHGGANGTVVTWYYYMMSTYNCSGYTQLSSDTLDNADPVVPSLINATVVNNLVQLNWLPFISPETFAFVIYRNNGGFNPIDTVYGRSSTQYTDLTSQPPLHPEEYIIAAMDSCGNIGTTTPVAHRTIHLTYGVAACAGYVDLVWTAYQGFAVSGYEVRYSINGGALQTVSLPSSTLSHQISGLSNNDSLCIHVEAIGASVTASSNRACFKVKLTQSLQDLAVTGLTVLTDQTVLVGWQANKADLIKILVQRSTDGSFFTNIKTFTPPFPSPIIMSYNDAAADPAARNWFYRIMAMDSCGDTLITQPAQTIYLKAKARPNFSNTLEWNDPDFDGGVVSNYTVYLDQGGWIPRGSSVTTDYMDNITDLLSTNGQFCYYVEAQGTITLPTGSINFIAASNIRCVKQFAIIYVPTAFVPGGTNSFFKPVITFGVSGTYKMEIYNRFGQLVFRTTDPNEAWDGTFSGVAAPQGVYAYVIEVQGPNNNTETKAGTVMLIR